jgi:hypothetical protein
VDVLDLKGQYPPQAAIAEPPGPRLYERVARAFPHEPHRDRITWDNDVAPSDYNRQELPTTLPASPLTPAPAASGFRWI